MLASRIATALVLLGVLLPAIFVFEPMVWGVLTLAFLAVAAWEWARLLPDTRTPVLAAAVVALGGSLALVWRSTHEWPRGPLLAVCAALAMYWVVVAPHRLRARTARGGGWLLASVLLLGCWLALLELRQLGPVPLLSSMAVIWVADIAAYFAGRAFGRRKLAPSISPGKSWEGVVGGFIAVAITGFVASRVPMLAQSLPAVLTSAAGTAPAAAALIAIAALSIVGDLYESLLKREAGVKDSSRILPGHGGILDRIDSLIPTMPVALAIFELIR